MNYNFVDSWVSGLTGTPVMLMVTCAVALIVAGVTRPASVRLRASNR